MHIFVKQLNGDLLDINCPDYTDFKRFTNLVYRSLTHIPHGCLQLTKMDCHEDDDTDEILALMKLADLFLDPTAISLSDGDMFLAIVDDSHINSFIHHPITVNIQADKNNTSPIIRVDTFRIGFDSHDQDIISSCEIIYNHHTNTFALFDSLERDCVISNQIGVLYHPTSNTIWYQTLQECLFNSNDRIPTSSHILDSVSHKFFNHEYEVTNDKYDFD